MRTVSISAVKTRPPFSTLFPMDSGVLDAIQESMRSGGFDASKPIDLWQGTVVDGHTRLRAAALAGIPQVVVYDHDFADELAALSYAITNQRNRRNLTGDEILACIAAVDKLKQRGRPGELAPRGANSGKSAEETAEVVGVSVRTVERVRTVLADDDARQAVEQGASINAAYKQARERRRHGAESSPVGVATPKRIEGNGATSLVLPTLPVAPPPYAGPESAVDGVFTVAEWNGLTDDERSWLIDQAPLGRGASFNRTNDHVEWALWTWNPVTGCLHNCPYCYARDIAARFYKQGFVPAFVPSRLHAPRHQKVPAAAVHNVGEKNVFCCSMADLFGKWVPQAWIDAVLAEAKRANDWNFLFLTKFPQKLAEQEWPDNAWCGTTVDRQFRVPIAEKSFRNVTAGVKWLSCEPMLERLTFTSLDMFDWVVIGGASKSSETPAFQPPWEWVEHLIRQARAAGCRVYLKPNLESRPREYPGEDVAGEVVAPPEFYPGREPA